MKATRYAKGLSKGIFWLTSLALLLALVLPSDGTGVVQASPDVIPPLRPNAAGTYQEWSLADTSHWGATSDQNNETYVYVYGSTTLKETENLADTTQTGTINSVTAYMRALAIGSAAVEKAVIVWRTYSTDYESAAINIGRTAFTDYSEERTTNPNTGQAWTWTEVNALEIGSRASTLGATETIQVSEYWIVVDYTPTFSTAISIVGKVADDAVGSITFPAGAPGATVSAPYNDVDGIGAPQVLHASASEPVVRLKNTSGGTLTVWLEITTWSNGVAASEDYELVATGTTTVEVVDDVLSADGNAASVNTGVTIAAAAYKALYLELVLSSLAGKSGSSTLTILGESA